MSLILMKLFLLFMPQEEPGRKVSSRIEAATNSDEEDSAEEDSEGSQELPVDPAATVLDTGGGQVMGRVISILNLENKKSSYMLRKNENNRLGPAATTIQ